MESVARLLVWFIVVIALLQLVQGGWPQLRAKVRATFIGVPAKAA